MSSVSNDIAIVGMAGRFPGAENVQQFWNNVLTGRECITRFEPCELLAAGVPRSVVHDPRYVLASPILDDFDRFDAEYFGYSPREANLMDPQQRLLLQTAVHTLNDGALDPDGFSGRIGVFAGAAANTYMLSTGVGDNFYREYLPTLIGNDKDFLATRVSFKLNLTGPSITVQTACSTSLVATHMACQSLLNMESDAVLAGGVSVRLPHRRGYMFEEGGVFSPDGHCRPFDAKAQGTLFGSGVAMVLLKRYDDAVAEGDYIYAVIKGSAVNNDGSSKADYTAPSVSAQCEAIAEATSIAVVDPNDIGYLEAHGTGTYLGDPIEVEALSQAYGETDQKQYCAIGSVKANVGHLDAAAGVTGLIKAALVVKNGVLPPSVNFEDPNPQIDFVNSPFYVNREVTGWPDKRPRIAGVSSLGIGGTNAHVVLEAVDETVTAHASSSDSQIITLSAKDATALRASIDNLAKDEVKMSPGVARSLWSGRPSFSHRATAALSNGAKIGMDDFTYVQTQDQPTPAFLFPGAGPQHWKMGYGLAHLRPNSVFAQHLAQICRILLETQNLDIWKLVYSQKEDPSINRLSIAMPALFAIEVAIARQLMHWGIEPQALCGHSTGEYAAAHIASVFSLEDALNIVCVRGRLCDGTAEGAMLAVGASLDIVHSLLTPEIAIAAQNGPNMTAVSGPLDAIDDFVEKLEHEDVDYRRLRVCVAAHSALLDPILEEFRAAFSDVSLSSPKIPIVSNVTGSWEPGDHMTTPDYWVRHLREMVRFADNIKTLSQLTQPVLIEVGPGTTLTTLARSQVSSNQQPYVFSTMRHPNDKSDDCKVMSKAIGQLWASGLTVDLDEVNGVRSAKKVPLPGYPFAKTRHWFEGTRRIEGATGTNLYEPAWTAVSLAVPDNSRTKKRIALIATKDEIAASVAEGLNTLGYKVDQCITRSIDAQPDYVQYLSTCEMRGELPELIIDLQAIDDSSPGSSLLWNQYKLFNATQQIYGDRSVRVVHCCRPFEEIAEGLRVRVDHSLLVGPVLAFGQESDGYSAVLLGWPNQIDTQVLLAEALDHEAHPIRILGKQCRWLRGTVPAPSISSDATEFPKGGWYLITGGFGGVGRTVARHLADNCEASVVLGHRRELSEEELQFISDLGGDSFAFGIDIRDENSVKELFEELEAKNITITGVFHTAGVLASNIASLKSEESVLAVLGPKVEGTHNLVRTAQEKKVPFITLFSSISAFRPPKGDADYASANAYQDSIAFNSDSATFVQSINWAGWEQTGMLRELNMPGAQVSVRECISTLFSAIAGRRKRIIVSPGPIETLDFTVVTDSSELASVTEYVPLEGPVEEFISEIWSSLLGIDRIGAHHNFLELGGDSLLATRVITRLASDLDIELTVSALFENPELRDLAGLVENVLLQQSEDLEHTNERPEQTSGA